MNITWLVTIAPAPTTNQKYLTHEHALAEVVLEVLLNKEERALYDTRHSFFLSSHRLVSALTANGVG
jgi:hypothetical protein